MSKTGYHAARSRFSFFTSLSTWVLILAGSLVTSTESGLSVPDWPLSYGQFFPPMVGGIRYEHTHRMIAGAVALLTLYQTIWIWRTEKRHWVRNLGLFSLILVIAQAVLGGLTVLLLLPPAVSILHALTAQTFFVLLIIISLVSSNHWWKNYETFSATAIRKPGRLPLLSGITLASVFIQVIFGAMKRHKAAEIHPHLLGALIVAGLSWSLFAYINTVHAQKKDVWLSSLLLCLTVIAELFLGLGAFAVRSRSLDEIVPGSDTVLFTATHVAIGALVLASATVLFLLSFGIQRNAGTNHSSE